MRVILGIVLKDRQKSILDAVIQEYIRTARPVASDDILGRLEVSLSPATVRNEMLGLNEAGYLEQPHTSAGRVPTDKGYRFFVDNLISDGLPGKRVRERVTHLFDTREEEEFIRDFSQLFSELSGNFAAAGVRGEKIFYKSGFSRLLAEPEFQDAGVVQMFGRLADEFEEEVGSLIKDWQDESERVFIGEENPIEEARFSGMIVSRWEHPKGFSGFVTMVGPRRMDYAKSISLTHLLREFND